jgi:hypothetical protein
MVLRLSYEQTLDVRAERSRTMTHISDWPIRLFLTEEGDRTVAHVVLTTGDNTLSAEGVALRNPHDPPVPEIGDELAAGRALVDLGRQLVSAAAGDVAQFGDEPVVLAY